MYKWKKGPASQEDHAQFQQVDMQSGIPQEASVLYGIVVQVSTPTQKVVALGVGVLKGTPTHYGFDHQVRGNEPGRNGHSGVHVVLVW